MRLHLESRTNKELSEAQLFPGVPASEDFFFTTEPLKTTAPVIFDRN